MNTLSYENREHNLLWKGAFEIHEIFDCKISDEKLDAIAYEFVAKRDPYFFSNKMWISQLLQLGVIVYEFQEFMDSFLEFTLSYGGMYNIWNLPTNVYVIMVSRTSLQSLNEDILAELLEEQVNVGRGHVYDGMWVRDIGHNNGMFCTFKDKEYFLLTREDWVAMPLETKRAWVLKWLRDNRADEPVGVFPTESDPYVESHLFVMKYSGRFPEHSGANCFASTIAAAVGEDLARSGAADQIIHEWLHQAPFYRMLRELGYQKHRTCWELGELSPLQRGDILVWQDQSGRSIHAAYVIKDGFVFNKMGQSWFQPWQVLRLESIYYNEVLSREGSIAVYRHSSD